MLPVIALVGRPNVGKSTLFNVLTRTRDALVADFHQLRLGEPQAISAAHGDGIRPLIERALEGFEVAYGTAAVEDLGIRVAVIGRPNVGKSTLINRLVGEERLISFDQPGT